MADFGGNDEQDIKINIDVVGAENSANELEKLADALDRSGESIAMLSPEAAKALQGAAGAVDEAAKKLASAEQRILDAAEAAKKAARAATPAETAKFDEDSLKRRAAFDAARLDAVKQQQEQEALASSVSEAAIQARIKALKGVEDASERIAQVEAESLKIERERRIALDGLLDRQEAITKEIKESEQRGRAAAKEASRLSEVLKNQKATELEPYSGELISPAAIASADSELRELQEKINKLREPIESARREISSAPTRPSREIDSSTGRPKKSNEVQLPTLDGKYTAEDQAARESFIKSMRDVLGNKQGKFDTSDSAKLFEQLSEVVQAAKTSGPGSLDEVTTANQGAAKSDRIVMELSATLKQLKDQSETAVSRMLEGPPKGASPKSAEARNYADTVASVGTISKQIQDTQSAIDAERTRGDDQRSIGKSARERFDARGLGVTAEQMPKLIELFTKIRTSLELKEKITATSPTAFVDESEALKRLPSSKELDDVIKRASDLEAELSRARGQSGEYKVPIERDGKVITSGPRIVDEKGRTDSQLKAAIVKAEESEQTEGKSQAGRLDSKNEIDKLVAEAEEAVVVAFRDSRRRMRDAVGPLVDSINLDEIFSDLLKDLADRMVAKFKSSGKRTEAEVEKFRERILSDGKNQLSAQPSFTKSGQQRRGSPILRLRSEDPEPDVPAVGGARLVLPDAADRLLRASPVLRNVSRMQGDREIEERRERQQNEMRLRANAARQLPDNLKEIGRIEQPKGTSYALMKELEAELTVLSGKEDSDRTDEDIARLEEINEKLKAIKNTAASISGSGVILQIIKALGVNPDDNLGTRERQVKGLESPLSGTKVNSLFTKNPSYVREEETPVMPEIGNPLQTMLTAKKENPGVGGIQLQTVTAQGEDLAEFFEVVEKTSYGITAIFAQITKDMRGGKASDPAFLQNLKDQMIGLLGVMATVQDLDIDTTLPADQQEKFAALKQAVAQLGDKNGGVLAALTAMTAGALTDVSASSAIGKNPDERKAIASDIAEHILTPLIPNLDALTLAAKTLMETKPQNFAGSGRAKIEGVPFGQPGAAGDVATLRGIVETIASGDAERIRNVIAEAIARNVLDADQLRSMIPGEVGMGVPPRSEDMRAISAVKEKEGQPRTKFDLGSGESRLKFADIIAGVPSIMEILGNYPSLSALASINPELTDSLSEAEEKAAEELAELTKRLKKFKGLVPKLISRKVAPLDETTSYGFSESESPGIDNLRKITDASTLSEDEARTITPSSIPPHLIREYKGAGRNLGRGVYGRTVTGFKTVPSDLGLSPDQAREVAQDVIDFLQSKGLSMATLQVAQQPGFAPLEDVAKGATGRIPEKTIITVIHKGDTILDDLTVATGLSEALKSLQTTPTVNRGVTIASYPSTDVRIPGADPTERTPPGYSGVTAGVNRGSGVVETFAMIHLAEQMRLRESGPLVPVPGAGAVASHETKHMAIIGGSADSLLQQKDVMLPVHRAIFMMMQRMGKEIAQPSANVTDELRAKMEDVFNDFFENIPPLAIQDAMISGSEDQLNKHVAEFLANAMAQMEGHKSGGGRGISHGKTGEFSASTMEFLGQMFGPRAPKAGGNYAFSESPSENPQFIEETMEDLLATYKAKEGFTRRIVRSGGELKVAAEEPESGYTVGGMQLSNPESGLLNFRKSEIGSTPDLRQALNALYNENKDLIEKMMMDGVKVYLGLYTQDIKDTDGKDIEGTAFDITEVIDDQPEAIARAKSRGQDSYGQYENKEFVFKPEFQLRDQADRQPLTMERNQDGSFGRIPGTLSGDLGPVTSYDYRTKSRQEAARTRRAERRASSSAELDQVLEGQTVTVSGGPIGTANIMNFDAYRCQQCGKMTSDREGGVTPNGGEAYCADCYKKVAPFYNEPNPKEGYKYDKYDSKKMSGSQFRGMVNRKTEGLDEEGLAELQQSEYEDHLGRYYRGEEGDDFGRMADSQERLFADKNIASGVAQSRAAFERKRAKREQAREGAPIEGTAKTITETPEGRIYGFSKGPEDPAILDFEFDDLEDDDSILEDSSDTYAPVEEEKPKPKKPRKKKAPVGSDDRSTLVTPREAEIAFAEEVGVSTEELATLTPAQTQGLIREKQEKDMAENAKRDEERLKTAGTRAEAARKRARKQNPRARLETPMEAQIDEGAEVGLSPDEAVRVDPSVIAKRKRDADEAKIAELNAADAARFKKIHDDQQARSDAAAAKEKAASDKKIAADAARAKAAEEEAKKAEESVPAVTEAPKVAAEPTKEEYDAQVVEDNAARKARVAAQRKARAAAKKAAVAAEQEAVAIESSAVESDRVAAVEKATVAESQQEVPAQSDAKKTVTLRAAGTPPPPNQPPAPPTPPAGDGDQPGGSSPLDAIVNQAIAAMGLGTSLPALQALINKLNETVDAVTAGRISGLSAAGIEADPAATRQQVLNEGDGKLLRFLENLASFATTIRSQGEIATLDVSGKPMRPADASQMFGNATNLPEGLSRANMMKIAEEFDILGTEVAGFIQMARNGTLKIKAEVQSAAGGGQGGGGVGSAVGSDGGDDGDQPMNFGTKGYATPDLVNIFKGETDLKNLSNVFRQLRPQVAHVSSGVDEFSTNLQKQNRAAQETTRALAGYMNVNTGILKSLKTQVGRAATFLFVQQMGREIAGVVEHLQSGVFKFNQILENTKVGFNTLFANTLQASSSAKNEMVPAFNAVGTQVGFVREQALTFNEALLLTGNAAENMVNQIRDIANITPFRFQPLVEASLKMKAFGFEAVEIPGMINSISNAVAALGGEDEKIDRIAYALGQMNSAGRVYQNDMMQLANAGIAGYRMLSEKMLVDLIALKKYTMGELKDLPDYVIEEMNRLQGAISGAGFQKSFGGMDQMIATLQDPRRAEGLIRQMAKRGFLLGSVAARAITEGMDKQYQGSADRLSRTMTGALSTIADLSQNFMATAFEPLFASVRDTIVELGQFMLKSQEITEFVARVRENVAGFIGTLKGFGPVLENMANIFISVFVGGVGAAMERGSQFGELFGGIVDKVSAGLALIGDILNTKVGRGLAAAATLGTLFFKAIMANPMIATLALIVVAISGIAEAIQKNAFGIGTMFSLFGEALAKVISVISEALATIAKDIGTAAIASFVSGLTVAITAFTPLLFILLTTFTLLLKILTPFAPILGVILGLFIAFKTATMLWTIATTALGKPIMAIAGAWGGASKAINGYQEQIKLTAQMHEDLKQKKISAQDFVRGEDSGQILRDNDGNPIINYDPRTETVSSAGYPSQERGEAAQAAMNAGSRVRGALEKIDERLPGPLKGLLTSPRERIFGAVRPDFNGGFALDHNDNRRPGHLSTVITNEKIEDSFDSLKQGGPLAALGQQLSAAGLLKIPGLDKGELVEGANKYATAYGENLKTLVLIEKEVSYVLSEAFRKMQGMAESYKAALGSEDPNAAPKILQGIVDSEEGRTIIPMLTAAKYGPDKKHTDLTKDEISGMVGSFLNGGMTLTPEQQRNVQDLPPGVRALLANNAAKRIASGESRLTGGKGGELEQLQIQEAQGRAKTVLKAGSVGALGKLTNAINSFFQSVSKGTANIIKDIPLLNRLQKVKLGGAGTGLQQIQQNDQGEFQFVNDDGTLGRRLSKQQVAARRGMRGAGRGLGRAMSTAGAMFGIASGASRLGGMPNMVLQGLDALGLGGGIDSGVRQTLSAKAGMFTALGNSVGTMLGVGFGSMIPIIGPIIGPAIGGMLGELAGNIADSMIRGSQAAIDAKKKMIESNKSLGLDAKTAEFAAAAELKLRSAAGFTGEGAGGIPFLVNDIPENETPEQKKNSDAFKQRLNTKDNLKFFDENKNGIIDMGTEMKKAIEGINFTIMQSLPNRGSSFNRNRDGSYVLNDAQSVATRAQARDMGYVENMGPNTAGNNLTADEIAATIKRNQVIGDIEAAAFSEKDFQEMFPAVKLNAQKFADFNATKITNVNDQTEAGLRMNRIFVDAGISKGTALASPMVSKLLEQGSDFGALIKQLQANKDSGVQLDDAATALLQYANTLKSASIGSFRDEYGVIREEFQSGMSRLLMLNDAQKTATSSLGADGSENTPDDIVGKTFKELFGFKAVKDGTGIGGGDTRYDDFFMEGLKSMGRIDPMEAMLEAGVIKTVGEMVGKSAIEIREMFTRTIEYFDAFRKRAEELEPKVNLRSSRLNLMEEFGADLGYKLFDQFAPQRAELAIKDKEYAALGGDRELADLEYQKQIMSKTIRVTPDTGRRDNGSIIPGSGGATQEQVLPGFMTSEETGKMERLAALKKDIKATEFQTFKIRVTSSLLASADQAVLAKAVADEGALLKFRKLNQAALDAIQAKKAAGNNLTREETLLSKQELDLRNKLFITKEEEVSLGQTLAILEKEGISISAKDLHNNNTLLQILAAKAKLQEASNQAGKGAVFYANLEAKAKAASAQLAGKQLEYETGRAAIIRANQSEGRAGLQDRLALYDRQSFALLQEIANLEFVQRQTENALKTNPYAFNKAELEQINALLARTAGSMLDAPAANAAASAIQRNSSLLNTMANVAQKAYDRIRKSQQKTHDEYIEQLDDQQEAIDDRYKKRGDEQQEQSLLEQLQLSGLAMRSESADPLEAAKSFYEAKNNLAEFYIEKQKNDEIEAISDEKERYQKQFQENVEAQEAIFNASMERMKTRFEAVSKVLGEEKIDSTDLKNLLLLTMTGKNPAVTANFDTTMSKLFADVDAQVAEGKQQLALGEGMGTISLGTLTPDGKAYTANPNLTDGNLDSSIKSTYGFDRIYKGNTEESGLLATFMNEKLAAGVSFTDSGKTYTGAAALAYLKEIQPKDGFEGGALKGKEEQGRERQGLFEYLTSLLSTTNTFSSSQKLAILAQRTLEQSISDFEKATKVDINMANLLEADVSTEMFTKFLKSIGQTPDDAKIKELQDLVRNTYSDVLTAMDAREYAKFANDADPRIGSLTKQADTISDAITHLKGALDGGLTTLDKLLFGTTYNSASPIPGVDLATEQLDLITSSILDMQAAFEGTMTNLEAYADSLEGPIGAFHQLAEAMALVAGITLPTAGTAAPTTPAPTTGTTTPGSLEERLSRPISEEYNPRGHYDGRGVSGSTNLPPEMAGHMAFIGVYDAVLDMVVDADKMSDRLKARIKEIEKMRLSVGEDGMDNITPITDEYRQVSDMPVPPIAEFNAELKARLAEYAAAFASSIQTVGINGAQTTVTMYNQIPITITINDAQDMNTADLAAQVEEAVGRAIRASGGSYISGTTS